MALALLCFIALLAYSNSFSSGFVFDNQMMLRDPRINAATSANLRLIFTRDYWYASTGTALYRPLATLSYLFNYAVLGNGTNPAGWHWVNLALHCLNLGLVYALALILLKDAIPASAMAAIWAVHPVLTEPVTNIIGRTDLLAAGGVLAGLLCHVRAPSASGWRRAAWLSGLALAAAIGISSKESAVILPALMALYDIAFRSGRPLQKVAPGYLVVLAPFAGYFYARSAVLATLPVMRITYTDNPLTEAGFWTARLTALGVIGKYLWLLVWPASLSCDYSYRQAPLFAWKFASWGDWQTLVACTACACAVAVAVVGWRRQRPLFFLVAFFFLTLAPTSNLAVMTGTIMAERFLYLPSVAFAGCLVVAGFELSRRLRPPQLGFAALGLIVFLFACRTFARNSDWLDDATLFASAVEAAPASYKAHMGLATALSQPVGPRTDDAIREIDKALAILRTLPEEKQNPLAYIDAGAYYGQKGELVAVRKPDGSLAATPASNYWYHKALDALLEARRIESITAAPIHAKDVASSRTVKPPRWHELYLALAAIYLRLDRPREAADSAEAGVRVWPAPEFFQVMSSAYTDLGDPHRAALALLEALTIDPSNSRFAAQLAEIYRKIDPQGCSIRQERGTASLNTACPPVHADLCTAARNVVTIYREVGNFVAVETYRNVVRELGCTP